MKYLYSAFLCLITIAGYSQNSTYRESGDTLYLNEKALCPGDTVHLKLGSAPNKGFIYIWERPTKFNVSLSGPKYLGNQYANTFLVYKGKEVRKMSGMTLSTPLFYLLNEPKFAFNMSLLNAYTAGEIKWVAESKTTTSKADELLKWKQLLDSGAITKEEYEAQKKTILGSN